MRKQKSGEEKLYINSLCVSGSSIKLSKPINKCCNSSNKIIKLTSHSGAPRRVHCASKSTKDPVTRQPLKVNTKEYKNFQVCSKELKQIYETVEVEDFERILSNANIPRNNEYLVANKLDEILRAIDADDIYENFFGKYYNQLYDLIGTRTS